MIQTSKLTNTLLAIIAVCLIVIAFQQFNVAPVTTAQAATSAESDLEQLSSITATSKAAQQQVEAIKAVATAIEQLAKATDNIAKSLEQVGTMVGELGGRMSESRAASPGGIVVTPEK